MLRKIIKINQDRCDGCGLCVSACHEGAIGLINGKAQLLREDYCDGLGDCLPACPQGAISFEEREALAYDHEAVQAAMSAKKMVGCVSVKPQIFNSSQSQLKTWPVQLKLAPLQSKMYDDADLLIAADCSAYAYANFHQDFIQNRTVLIGCPKLDNAQYENKLKVIFANHQIRSIKVVRMDVPCCGGLSNMVQKAIMTCGKSIPLEVITISTKGFIL